MIGIDTCTWFKIFRLKDKVIDILDVIKDRKIKLFFTHDLVTEVTNYFPELEREISHFPVLPRLEKKLEYDIDPADLSLIEYSLQRDYLVITEDPEMRTIGYANKLKVISLGEFIVYLVENDILNKTTGYRIIRFLRGVKNLGKREFKRMKKEVQRR